VATPTVQVGAEPMFDIGPLNTAGRTGNGLFDTWLGAEYYAAQYGVSQSIIGWRVKCTTVLPLHVGKGMADVGNAVATYTGELLIVEARDLADLRLAFSEALRGNVDFTK
jgi:hypothetical protein